MTAGAYEKIEGQKAKKFIERLNEAWRGSPFDAARTVVHARPLSFVKGWMLAEASDAVTMPEKKCIALDNGQTCVPVEYSPDFITNFAANQNMYLSHATAPDYVRFWFEYVRSGPEKFQLVETLDDIPWREEPTPQARKSLAKMITPLTLTGPVGTGFAFKACVLFRDTLFDCTLEVTASGGVHFTNRTIMAESLTVTDSFTGF
ncbi:MAG: hypothetical protein KGQ41_04605 [Alphaproteobacteria bacterium]|nr:hypothetical protein [Alphaproteobacteria bacterium]